MDEDFTPDMDRSAGKPNRSAAPPPALPSRQRVAAPPPAKPAATGADAAPSNLPGLPGLWSRLHKRSAQASHSPATSPRISRDPDGVPSPLPGSMPTTTSQPALQTALPPPTPGQMLLEGDARPTRLGRVVHPGGFARLLFVIVSLLLIALIGSVLLLSHGLLIGQRPAAVTPQVNTPPTLTAEANAISTQATLLANALPRPITTPYHVQVPGSCVDTSGVWQFAYDPNDDLRCLPTSAQLTARGKYGSAWLQFTDPPTGPMNRHFAASIHIAQLEKTGCASIGAFLSGNGDLEFQVCGNGEITIVDNEQTWQVWYNGYIAPLSDLTMTLSYDGANATFKLNQAVILTHAYTTRTMLNDITLSLDTTPLFAYNTPQAPLTTGSTSADFSDFNYIPLP